MPLDALISLTVLGLGCWATAAGCFYFRMRVLGWLLGFTGAVLLTPTFIWLHILVFG